MGLNVIVNRESIYSVLSFSETHVTTLECVSYANLCVDARCWEVRNYCYGNIKQNRKLSCISTITHRVRMCLHLKQSRRVLTEKNLSITLGICELSFIKLRHCFMNGVIYTNLRIDARCWMVKEEGHGNNSKKCSSSCIYI